MSLLASFPVQILRSVEDSNGFVFNVPPGCRWDILVEIPDRRGHLEEPPEEALSQDEGMWQELPVLMCVGQRQLPSTRLDLNDDTRRVCSYLHAFKHQTINQLYSGGRGGAVDKVRMLSYFLTPTVRIKCAHLRIPFDPQDVVIVLDASSSMGFDLDWLGTCKQSLLRICHDRLLETDRVAVIVFQHQIRLEIPLALLTAQHKRRIAQELEPFRPGGGTDLWSAMIRATDILSAQPVRSKWIIALTDGASEHSTVETQQRVQERLRQEDAESVNILAITVNLNEQSRAQIQAFCVDGRQYGREDNPNKIIRADGELAELEEAWEEAGKTVSEMIEQQGDVLTDDDCHALLREYMDWEARPSATNQARFSSQSSLLEQSYWVRYLERRCDILRSSEKFNMNQRFPEFGSSTMVSCPRTIEFFRCKAILIPTNEFVCALCSAACDARGGSPRS